MREYDYQNGDGVFVREPGVLQPSARKLLEEVGGEEIKTLQIVRTPLSSFTKGFLNAISLGQFEKISKKYYDQMFHLSLWINDKYNLEKNEVVYFNRENPKKSNSQVKDVKNIPAGLTIQQLIDNAKKRMGPENFSNYDAEKLNCQNFLINVLDGSDAGDKEDGDFIFQDATKIFKELPEYAKVLGKASVKLGAIFNRLIYGEGGDFHIMPDGSIMEGKTHGGACGKPMGECMCGYGALEDFMKRNPNYISPTLQQSGQRFANDISSLKRYYGGGPTNIMKYADAQLKW